jgi:hypothetical protein
LIKYKLPIINLLKRYITKYSISEFSFISEIQSALLTRSEVVWLLGKCGSLSKKIERDLRYRINRKIRIFTQSELPWLKESGFATALGNDAAISNGVTTGGSGIGHHTDDTVRSSIAAARVAPNDANSKPNEAEEYEKEMLRPGFEPGISDSKGLYRMT